MQKKNKTCRRELHRTKTQTSLKWFLLQFLLLRPSSGFQDGFKVGIRCPAQNFCKMLVGTKILQNLGLAQKSPEESWNLEILNCRALPSNFATCFAPHQTQPNTGAVSSILQQLETAPFAAPRWLSTETLAAIASQKFYGSARQYKILRQCRRF